MPVHTVMYISACLPACLSISSRGGDELLRGCAWVYADLCVCVYVWMDGCMHVCISPGPGLSADGACIRRLMTRFASTRLEQRSVGGYYLHCREERPRNRKAREFTVE